MTWAQWVAWVVAVLTAVMALWLASEAAGDLPALRDEVDRLRGEVARLADVPRKAAESRQEPRTRPIHLPVPERHDTEPVEAVLDRGLREFHGATASGRHRAP